MNYEEVRREVNLFGTVRYCSKDGDIHRLDGPAIEYADGTKYWYQNGKYHRLDGPAYEEPSGYKEWWLNGKYYKTEKEWEKARCPSIEEAIKMFKGVNP